MILIEKISRLDEEKEFNKRLISEVIHIKQQKQSLNLQNDTYSLDLLYMNCLRNCDVDFILFCSYFYFYFNHMILLF